jgi:hypothetical protein
MKQGFSVGEPRQFAAYGLAIGLNLILNERMIEWNHVVMWAVKNSMLIMLATMSLGMSKNLRDHIAENDELHTDEGELEPWTLIQTTAGFFFVLFFCLPPVMYFFSKYSLGLLVQLGMDNTDPRSAVIWTYLLCGNASAIADNGPVQLFCREMASTAMMRSMFRNIALIAEVPMPLMKASLFGSMGFGFTFVFSNITNVLALAMAAMVGYRLTVKQYISVSLPVTVVMVSLTPVLSYVWVHDLNLITYFASFIPQQLTNTLLIGALVVAIVLFLQKRWLKPMRQRKNAMKQTQTPPVVELD